ncbi:MAG: hypothetical protein SangKO_096010 [Sandaracinaceae bacterium]
MGAAAWGALFVLSSFAKPIGIDGGGYPDDDMTISASPLFGARFDSAGGRFLGVLEANVGLLMAGGLYPRVALPFAFVGRDVDLHRRV